MLFSMSFYEFTHLIMQIFLHTLSVSSTFSINIVDIHCLFVCVWVLVTTNIKYLFTGVYQISVNILLSKYCKLVFYGVPHQNGTAINILNIGFNCIFKFVKYCTSNVMLWSALYCICTSNYTVKTLNEWYPFNSMWKYVNK